MNQRNYALTNSTVLQDIRTLSHEELSEDYSIHISEEDGSVWDAVEDCTFNNIQLWAEFIADQDNDDLYGGVTRIGGKQYFDDNY